VPSNRRVLVLLAVALAVAAPAAALRFLCVGRACRRAPQSSTVVPFCSLPVTTRDLIAAGFRDGRGPHVLAVAGGTTIAGATGMQGLQPAWPSARADDASRVPLVFWGTGVDGEGAIESGVTLDGAAPTLAELIRLNRPHPDVRSGRAIESVIAGSDARLAVVVVWKGVGSRDLEDQPGSWPVLRRLLREGAGTLDARVGSLPLDPAAVLTTIGTGGLPQDHGITGSTVRNDRGRAVLAWGPSAPFSVIATLGDDLDERFDQAPRIGLVGTAVSDGGLIGGNWYIENDRDDVIVDLRPGPQSEAAERLLATGYGRDDVPDLLAVAMEGPLASLDRALGRLVAAADRASGGEAAVVVTGTGSVDTGPGAVQAREVERLIESELGVVVEATAVGGLFLDQEATARLDVSDDRVVAAARDLEAPGGGRLFADVFPQIAVTFARYC
jgi:hypothetical protein